MRFDFRVQEVFKLTGGKARPQTGGRKLGFRLKIGRTDPGAHGDCQPDSEY